MNTLDTIQNVLEMARDGVCPRHCYDEALIALNELRETLKQMGKQAQG